MTPNGYRAGYVALMGRPNAGKSTLLNCILGQKIAITASQPETTRRALLGIKHLPEGQIGFLDTPGLPYTHHAFRLNRKMRETLTQTISAADLILVLVTPKTYRDDVLFKLVAQSGRPCIVGLNKTDLSPKAAMIPILDQFNRAAQYGCLDIVPVSAKTGDNIKRLLQVVLTHLPEGEPIFPEDQVTDQPMRFLAAEIVREKIIAATREELPHVVAVGIDQYDESQEGKVVIAVTIFVEKTSQKKIVIGEKGAFLKKVKMLARRELKEMLDTRVTLEVWVKVKKDWRESDAFLKEQGYA